MNIMKQKQNWIPLNRFPTRPEMRRKKNIVSINGKPLVMWRHKYFFCISISSAAEREKKKRNMLSKRHTRGNRIMSLVLFNNLLHWKTETIAMTTKLNILQREFICCIFNNNVCRSIAYYNMIVFMRFALFSTLAMLKLTRTQTHTASQFKMSTIITCCIKCN